MIPEDSPSRKSSPSKFSFAGLKQRALGAAIGGSSADAADWDLSDLPASFFDLEAQDAKGCTPIIAAAKAGSAECVETLLKAGADENTSERCWGKTLDEPTW